MDKTTQNAIDRHLAVLDLFSAGEISASDFEDRYLRLFEDDPEIYKNQLFNVLDKLFADVDSFCADPGLRDEQDIDEHEFKRRVTAAAKQLKTIRDAA